MSSQYQFIPQIGKLVCYMCHRKTIEKREEEEWAEVRVGLDGDMREN
jgi:hypothetical protein